MTAMCKGIARAAIGAGLLVAVSSIVSFAEDAAGQFVSSGKPAQNIIMTPGEKLSLDLDKQHIVGYFEPKDASCDLTIVLAVQDGGLAGTGTPGTRINVPVVPGKAAQIDGAGTKWAKFWCRPGGRKMSARLFDR